MEVNCEICGNDRFVDAHHYDCKEGKISPETINLCRRCHRTYHDRGINWFDDDKIDKAIEIENKRRELVYANLVNPTKPLILLKREDIQRSEYWNKIHGIYQPPRKTRETSEQKQLGFKEIDDLMRLELK
ncbi:MAG: hypothetical protein V1709_07040 [Planctomycetota bacterium]